MDRELESLLLAFEAWLEAGEDDAARCQAVFESQVEVILAGRPNLTKERLV